MKKIALLSDGWKRFVTYSWTDGITKRIKELGLDACLYQFNTNGNWSHDSKYNSGEYELFYFPDLKNYDGIIFDCSNMTDREQIDRIVEHLKTFDIPVVSISYAVEGFYYVGNDNKKLFRSILDHLHDVHGCKRYVFAGGPDYNYENQMRFEAFQEAMADYGIPLTEDMYMFDDFDFDSGVRYMEDWIEKKKPFPDAFVCANDNIATGMCSAADRHGLKIPDDFIVTGFDNLEKAAYYYPQITTVEHNRGNIGKNAVQILADLWEGKKVEPFSYLFSECIPGESCGCPNNGLVQYRHYIKCQIEWNVTQDREDEEVMVLENQIMECEDIPELCQRFSHYIQNQDCDGVYFIFDQDLLHAQLNTHFPTDGYDRSRLVVGYASEHQEELPHLKTLAELEQHLKINGKNNCYLFTGIHFRNELVGLTILKNPNFLYDNSCFYDTHHTFVSALESLYKQLQLEHAYDQMKEVFNRDSLTGLYNRVAYNEMILPKFEYFCEQGVVCSMIFFDVDYFKQINDTYGHKFGDEVLKTIASVLMSCKPKDGYAYRFGGDEFVVFFPYATEEKINAFVSEVIRRLRCCQIEVSNGVILTDPKSNRSLDDYLVLADAKMYQVKSARKKNSSERKSIFLKGVDISFLPERMDGGAKFYNAEGKEVDAFRLLTDNNINSIRLRIWNEPNLVPEAKGYCDLAHTLEFAKEIKKHHLHFCLDFHYSDYWADPGQQRKPHAWQSLSFEELKQAVYDYTYDVLFQLGKIDCLPDMVQVGNEIRSGMLFPDGEVPAYRNLAELVNAGIRAVRDISKNIQVMIHLDQGGRFYYLKEWFDEMFAAGMDAIDAIGISFYSFWHGTFMDLEESMSQLISRYHLPVYVMETAHPWRHCEKEHVSKDLMKTAGLPAGIKEQKTSLELIMQIASDVSGAFPTGVYYWEPLGIPDHDYGSWDESMGMLDQHGKELPGFEAFRDFNPKEPPLKNLKEFIEKLYEVDEDHLPKAMTNLIPNSDFSEELKGWWEWKKPDTVIATLQDGEMYVSCNSNFVYQISREIKIEKEGLYQFFVDYRGTNTTNVHVTLYLKIISCNGEKIIEKEIFPSDVRFVTHSTDVMTLPRATVQIGLKIDAPPIFGRFKNFRLVRLEETTGL